MIQEITAKSLSNKIHNERLVLLLTKPRNVSKVINRSNPQFSGVNNPQFSGY